MNRCPDLVNALVGGLERAAVACRSMTLRCDPRGREEEGQGMVEYAVVLVLIAVVIVVVLSVLGRQTKNMFSNVSNGLNQ